MGPVRSDFVRDGIQVLPQTDRLACWFDPFDHAVFQQAKSFLTVLNCDLTGMSFPDERNQEYRCQQYSGTMIDRRIENSLCGSHSARSGEHASDHE